ncbi:MAG TPA: cyclic nucleotide-binding domain-containing protein [Streptosporangiaceae bacterium]|jgi:CRP-like cAMP-binding protein
MTTQEMSVLGRQPFLRGLPGDHLAKLAAVCRHVGVPAGQRLFEEGATADRFWLIDAGQVAIDTVVPGRGRLTIETIGRGDVTGVSWLLPPYQWRFGAVTRQRMQAFEFDARAVRAICDEDPAVGYQLSRRISGILARRLEATQARLRDSYAHSDTAS